ncbi:3-ketoacyl-CoA synthase 5-like protein [Tanacetum coccineum]
MSKILVSSGQSQRTCIPPSLHYIPPRSTNEDAINEAQTVPFPVFEDLLSKTQLSPLDIKKDVLHVAGELLRTNSQTLGSSILPLEEKIKYGFLIIRKKFLNNSRELYIPNFKKTHVSIFKAAPVAPSQTNTDRGRILASADTIARGLLPDKGPTPATNSRKRNTRKP